MSAASVTPHPGDGGRGAWSARGGPWFVVALLTCVYLLSMSGRQASPDEEVFFRRAVTFAESHRLDLGPISTVPAGHYVVPGVDGRSYSIYGPTLLAAHYPLVLLGQYLPASWTASLRPLRDQPFAEPPFTNIGVRWAFSLAGPLAAGLVLVFVVRLARYWQLSATATVVAVLTVGLATPVWAYTKTAFRDLPLTALLLAGLLETMIACRQQSKARSALAGMLLGLAFVAKDQAIVQGVLAIVFIAARIGGGGALATTGGFVAASLPIMVFKWVIAGTMRDASGYPLLQQLTTPLLTGFTGLVLSPGKGIVWYAPVLVLAVGGLMARWRQARDETTWLAVNLLTMTLVPSIWWFWHGGLSWGPRLLLPLMPWLGVLAVWGVTQTAGRWRKPLFAGLAALGILVNVGGLALDWHLYYVLQEQRYVNVQQLTDEEYYGRIAFNPADSMILAGWRAAGMLPTVPPPPELRDPLGMPAWYVLQGSRELLVIEAWRKRAWAYLGVVALLCGALLLGAVVCRRKTA